MNAQELIKQSLYLLGILAPGESLSSDEANDALTSLNNMIDSWSAKKLMLYANTKESFTISAGTSSYTIGSGGTLNTVRPQKILSAFVRDSAGIDYTLDIITQEEYNSIITKTTQGIPFALYYDPQYPLGTIYFYYVPNLSYTLTLESRKALSELATLTTSADTSYPPEYREALIYNLAIRLAPKYGKAVAPEVAGVAEDTYRTLKALNSTPVVSTLDFGRVNRQFNINNGEFR